jgi:outer membrane lipoprotein-sorting protein
MHQVTLETIIKRLDTLYRSDTAYAEMEMTIQTPHWERTLTMKSWSEGLDKTFIVIESPRREKGISTLRKGNGMWNFFPKINKVIKIPPSMMMGSWMGSDFTNDDLVKESTRMEDYHAKLIQGENRDSYHVEFVPHKDTVSLWGKIVSEIDKKSLLPISEIFYDEKNRKIRELYFKEVRAFGNKTIPAVMELIPTTKKGHKTIVRYTSAKFDVQLAKETFTLRNLKKKRR